MKLGRKKLLSKNNINSLNDYYDFIEILDRKDRLSFYIIGTYGLLSFIALLFVIIIYF